MNVPDPARRSPLVLLGEPRFAPFFWTQFMGAFNDNVFKNSLIMFLTFGLANSLAPAQISIMNNLAAGLFILPYLLFSALAGHLADRIEKSRMIRLIKLAEIAIVTLGAVGFLLSSLPVLMVALFCLGSHSAFFGPVKYSIMPQHLHAHELLGGNALVEAGTFLAILGGTLLAGLLSKTGNPALWVALTVITTACAGWWASRAIPVAPPVVAARPGERFNPLTDTLDILRFTRSQHTVFICLTGISWFWFMGATYLTQLPSYTRYVLGADQSVLTLLLTLFSIGIAVGSLLCERLSGAGLRMALVSIGGLGMTLFGIDVFIDHPTVITGDSTTTISKLLAGADGYRILTDYIGLGISGGLYIVPLYTLVLQISPAEQRSRIIAAINIFNALFMIASALTAMVCLGMLDISLPRFMLGVALLNGLVMLWLCRADPAFMRWQGHPA